jgi:putative flavoprotein involved in K+ transport
MRRVLASIDAHIDATHLEALDPDSPGAMVLPRAPDRIEFAGGRFSTVIWATGYRREYPWLKVPGVVHGGEVVHRDGFTKVPGLSVLGFKLQSRRNSHFIGGVGPDAVALARHLDRARPAVRPSRTRNRIHRHTSLAMPRPA